jgi:hypothetical protein
MTQDAKKTGFWRSIVAVAWAMRACARARVRKGFRQHHAAACDCRGAGGDFCLVLALIWIVNLVV